MTRPAEPTPGLWFVSEINSYLIVDMRSQPVAVVSKTFVKEDEAKANARLIAAAPEMRDLLAETVACLKERFPVLSHQARKDACASKIDAILARIKGGG